MPTELWEKFIVLLDLEDIKSVRLAWRKWTNIAARFLFRPLVFRVDRQDVERFEIVAQNPSMLAGIDSIQFEIGTVGIERVVQCLGLVYMQEYNSAKLPSPRTEYTPEDLELAKDVAIYEYAAWNTRWHEPKQGFREMSEVNVLLAKLKSLRRIDVTGKSTSFTSALLLEAWMQGSDRENFKRVSWSSSCSNS